MIDIEVGVKERLKNSGDWRSIVSKLCTKCG